MILADTSLLIAGFASWHERHDEALGHLHRMHSVIFPAACELYSVLTRLPGEARVAPASVTEWLDDRFDGEWRSLDSVAPRARLGRLVEVGVSGGATYDGLIALTAASFDATLVSLDRRALPTYRRCGVRVEVL